MSNYKNILGHGKVCYLMKTTYLQYWQAMRTLTTLYQLHSLYRLKWFKGFSTSRWLDYCGSFLFLLHSFLVSQSTSPQTLDTNFCFPILCWLSCVCSCVFVFLFVFAFFFHRTSMHILLGDDPRGRASKPSLLPEIIFATWDHQ